MNIAMLVALSILMVPLTQASDIGTYRCKAVDPVRRVTTTLINLDTNEISYLKAGADPADPKNWLNIFSSIVPTFCGFSPADSGERLCQFATTFVPENGYVSKNLNCEQKYENGSTRLITAGTLYLFTKDMTGSLSCDVYGRLRFNLKFSACEKI
jgi:hypothetical protein